VGPRLSKMERTCISSYLRHGHRFRLFTYEQIAGVPAGTIIEDANSIVPAGEIARFQNLANFSDYFRYSMLLKRGGWWVDLDAYCVKPFDFTEPYVFSTQYERNGDADEVNSGVIKAPAQSDMMRYCLGRVAQMDVRKTGWAEIGPALMVESVRRFKFEKYVKPSRVFCPLHYFEAPSNMTSQASGGTTFHADTRSVHSWNEEWRRVGLDKDAAYPESLYDRLTKAA